MLFLQEADLPAGRDRENDLRSPRVTLARVRFLKAGSQNRRITFRLSRQ
jgi:hypothetical protein